jgi:hypothetical protein
MIRPIHGKFGLNSSGRCEMRRFEFCRPSHAVGLELEERLAMTSIEPMRVADRGAPY